MTAGASGHGALLDTNVLKDALPPTAGPESSPHHHPGHGPLPWPHPGDPQRS